jgi:hypothetical protein
VAAFKDAVVVQRLPKTRSGKILRGTMKNREAQEHEPPQGRLQGEEAEASRERHARPLARSPPQAQRRLIAVACICRHRLELGRGTHALLSWAPRRHGA